MKVLHKVLTFSTRNRFELIDITGEVENAVRGSGVKNGIALIQAPHATAAIVINENEPGLREDMIELVKEITGPGRGWRHNAIDDNAHAHLGSMLLGSSKALPIVDGRLYRGTWQNIFLLEMDGPRNRREVVITIIGE